MKKIPYFFIILTNLLLGQTNYSQDSIEIKRELKEAVKPFDEVGKYGLGFIRYYPTGEYSSTGATFKIFNPSSKTIKYIWFTVAGENPVGDLVMNGKGYYKTLKAIGPVNPDGIGEWSFDYVWLTDIVESLRISTIKIQYMDLSFKTIKYNENMYIGQASYDRLLLAFRKEETFSDQEKERIISENDSTVFSDVDQTAEFPGGNDFLRHSFNNNFDQLNTLNLPAGIYKAEINFIIEKNGTISNIQAVGPNETFNNESSRAFKSIKTKWKPAKISAIPVRSRFKMPITKNIE